MYSSEIEKILKDNNYRLGGKQLLDIIDINKNPQIKKIKFNPYDNSYDMWDENNHFHFTAIKLSQNRDEER